MENGKTLSRKSSAAVVLSLTILMGMGIFAVAGWALYSPEEDAGKSKADIITIDGLKQFGVLERPAVQFPHDAHTLALSRQNKDCSTCHLKQDDKLSIKFKRVKDTSRGAVMDIYHEACISCHVDMKGSVAKTGPVACGECHLIKPAYTSNRQPMGFDRSLHYRHVKAAEEKCADCHHVYDEKQQKLVPGKGEETTCRHCHKEKTIEKRISMREASHRACVACHLSEKNKGSEKPGPVRCEGCHDSAKQKAIQKLTDIPRMKRNQPDAVLVSTGVKGKDVKKMMDPVPFDHMAHETSNDTCRVCHHAAMDACSNCHTVEGIEKGGFVSLETAMHQNRGKESCIGCHETATRNTECAGCHVLIRKKAHKKDDSCRKCHSKLPGNTLQNAVMLQGKDNRGIAEMMLKNRKKTEQKQTFVNKLFGQATRGVLSAEDTPELVTIKHLSKKYEPVKFPHRKIVAALEEGIKDNRLAQYFHGSQGTICQGCHHNSPVSKNPPQCNSCHGKPFQDEEALKPGIMGAYHMQCLGCHKEMGIEKPMSCTDCHKKK